MISANLQQWIQHPETLNKDTLYELRTLVTRYPYFQSLRLLYLKNLYLLHDISFGAELRKAILHVADRRKLFYLIEGERYILKPRKKRTSRNRSFRGRAQPRSYAFPDRCFSGHRSRRGFSPDKPGLCNGLYHLFAARRRYTGTERNSQTSRS